jgi:hypothetical protein
MLNRFVPDQVLCIECAEQLGCDVDGSDLEHDEEIERGNDNALPRNQIRL